MQKKNAVFEDNVRGSGEGNAGSGISSKKEEERSEGSYGWFDPLGRSCVEEKAIASARVQLKPSSRSLSLSLWASHSLSLLPLFVFGLL